MLNVTAELGFSVDGYRSSESGLTLYASEINPQFNELLEDERVFDANIHEQEVHVPVAISDVTNFKGLRSNYSRCLDMPVRLKGQSGYCIPEEWERLAPLLQQMIDVEHAHNPHWKDYYTYLTVDSSDVTKGEQQRHAGLHTDGFQGAREPEKTKGSRAYVMTTNGGTRYFPQTFIAGLDPARFNVFSGFDLQAGEPEIMKEYTTYFMSCYAVHESGEANRDGQRLFVRMVWEMKKFDRDKNTHNSMIQYDWEAVTDDIRTRLKDPTWEDLQKASIIGK